MAGLPDVTNSSFPDALDSFIDPVPTSPTGYATPTDHAAEHSKINDVGTVVEGALFGVQSTLNNPLGLPLIDAYGRLTMPAPAINVPIIAYGHGGLVIPPSHATIGADVLTLTNKRLSGLGATTYAVASSRMIDVFYDLLGGYGGAVSGASWTAPKPGIVLIDAEKDDFYNPTSGSSWGNLSTQSASNWAQALQAVIALVQSNTRVRAASGTLTGTWSTTSGNFTSGSCESTTSQNASVIYPTITVPPCGYFWHLGFVTTSPTGDTTFSINTVNVGGATSGGAAGATAIWSNRVGSVNAPSTFMPQITQITATPGATVQLTATKTDASVHPIYADSLIVPETTLPLVVVVYDNLGNNTNPVPTGPASGWTTQLTVAANNKPLLDAALGAVVAPLTNVATVNLNSGLSGPDLSYVTGNALNDRGHRKFSDLLSYVIGYWISSNDSDAIYETL